MTLFTYCLEHAMEELDMIQYYDQNESTLGKFIATIPRNKVRKQKCRGGIHNTCNKWGKYVVEHVKKKVLYSKFHDRYDVHKVHFK